MDIFMEYLIERKKTIKDRLLSIAIVILAIILGLTALAFIPSFGLFAAVAIGYGAYWLITSRNIEYEYCLTNGELDIDKIIAQRKRKRLLSIHCREFELFAPVHNEKYKREFNNVNIQETIEAMSSMNAENLYFATFVQNGVRTKLIFQPTQKMIDAFKQYNPRKVFTE